MIRRRTDPVTQLGYATQLVTVRAIGMFQPDPAAVPEPVVAAVARQLGIDDPGVLAGYRDMPVRWRHTAEIRDRYGYRDFTAQPGRFAFTAWLYRQAWADEVAASSVLFCAARRQLLARRILLPGHSVLMRLAATVRERATYRVHSRLARAAGPELRAPAGETPAGARGTAPLPNWTCCGVRRSRRRSPAWCALSTGSTASAVSGPESWTCPGYRRRGSWPWHATPARPATVIGQLSAALDAAWRRTATGYAANPDLRIEHRKGRDEIVLPPLDADPEPASLVTLRSEVERLLPEVEIADLPLEVHGWTGFLHEYADETCPPLSSPRIRDIGRLQLYRLGAGSSWRARYPHAGALLTQPIQTQLIADHLNDLLRLVGSMKFGHTTASLLIAKLHARSRQTALARALQEYGRLIRTIYLCRYVANEELRRRVRRQLNKGESLHARRRDLFFAHQGHVHRRHLDDQVDQALCLTLVTNAAVLWTTTYLGYALDALRTDGYPVTDPAAAHLTPAQHDHINFYGTYSFDVETELRRQGHRPLRSPAA